jgi:hypothetical protein
MEKNFYFVILEKLVFCVVSLWCRGFGSGFVWLSDNKIEIKVEKTGQKKRVGDLLNC